MKIILFFIPILVLPFLSFLGFHMIMSITENKRLERIRVGTIRRGSGR